MGAVEFSRLVLRGFGVYEDEAVFEFGPGINTYIGPNESGKSTLAAGIAAVLFGLVQSSDETAFSIERYKSWSGPVRFEGEVEFNSALRQWHVKRSFADNSVLVRWRTIDSPWQELLRGVHNPRANKPNSSYLGFLRDYLGVESYELFRQTFFVEQPLPAGTQIESKVQELLSGGGTYYDKVLKTLVSNLKDLTMDWNAYCRSLGSGRAERRLDAVRRQRRELAQQVAAQSSDAEELIAAKEQIAMLQKQRGELVNIGSTYQSLRMAFANWQVCRERYELERSRASNLQNALKQVEMLHAELTELRDPYADKQRDKISSLQQELKRCADVFEFNYGVDPSLLPIEASEVVEKRLSLTESEERVSRRLQQAKASPTRSYWPLIVGLLLAALSLGVPGGVAGGVIAVIVIGAGLALSMLIRKDHPTVKVYSDELAELNMQIAELERSMPCLAGRNVSEIRKLKQDVLSYRSLCTETELAIERLKSEARVVVREKEAALRQVLLQCKVDTVENLKTLVDKQQDQIYFSLREWKSVIGENPGLPSTDEDIVEVARQKQRIEHEEAQIQVQLATLEEKLFTLRQKQGELEGKALHNIAQSEDLVRELEIEELTLTAEARAVGMAIEELEAAAQEFQASYRQRLEDSTGQHFGRITGTNRQVVVNEEFCLLVRTEEGRLISPEQLSQGAQDQLYLALRLSIADLTAAQVDLPLILDDPFLTSDEGRLEHLRQALQNMGRQCLLLSHSSRFADWGAPVR